MTFWQVLEPKEVHVVLASQKVNWTYPLSALQVNLDTGVANGVLVVRRTEDCAQLLRNVLTNAMEFDVQEDNTARMWYLRERISGSIFRVVSKDRKLTNCFWNFYLQQQP